MNQKQRISLLKCMNQKQRIIHKSLLKCMTQKQRITPIWQYHYWNALCKLVCRLKVSDKAHDFSRLPAQIRILQFHPQWTMHFLFPKSFSEPEVNYTRVSVVTKRNCRNSNLTKIIVYHEPNSAKVGPWSVFQTVEKICLTFDVCKSLFFFL